MQFHLNGFRPGDPDVQDAVSTEPSRAMPAEVDVLIVGCGPAGLTLAAYLAGFPEISTRIVERKSGPLEVGQADGIAVRSVEMFNAYGFAEKVLREGYWVNETAFWRPDQDEPTRITRSNRIKDVEDGLSEFPHVILNQARVHDFYLEAMRNAPTRLVPNYDRDLISLTADPSSSHPVMATLDHDGQTERVRARYVVGCDGARSKVRQEIGLPLIGDSANKAWGVMDVLAITDFPDIRLKAVIQSANQGNVLIIPREGGYLVRLYIEMDKLAEGERVASRAITAEHLIAAAQRILHPYTLDVKEVAWWSIYEIGQRLTDRFDNRTDQSPPSVFIAGDACHTHSPKAGQGMNVSMGDAFNLGWKLAAVLRGQANPILLQTYSDERRDIAQTLIDFDRAFAAMFSAPPKTSSADENGIDPKELQRYFRRHAQFTAGTATQYAPSLITARDDHQHLAKGFQIGTRFHSAPVIRLADAKPMHLGHCIKTDGRWRLFVFAGPQDPSDPGSAIYGFCEWLSHDAASPYLRYTENGADIDAIFDVRAVFQQNHRTLDITAMPQALLPRKGRHGLIDYEKMFCPVPDADVYEMRGISRQGCVAIIRPDQHIAAVLPLNDTAAVAGFFDEFMCPVS